MVAGWRWVAVVLLVGDNCALGTRGTASEGQQKARCGCRCQSVSSETVMKETASGLCVFSGKKPGAKMQQSKDVKTLDSPGSNSSQGMDGWEAGKGPSGLCAGWLRLGTARACAGCVCVWPSLGWRRDLAKGE